MTNYYITETGPIEGYGIENIQRDLYPQHWPNRVAEVGRNALKNSIFYPELRLNLGKPDELMFVNALGRTAVNEFNHFLFENLPSSADHSLTLKNQDIDVSDWGEGRRSLIIVRFDLNPAIIDERLTVIRGISLVTSYTPKERQFWKGIVVGSVYVQDFNNVTNITNEIANELKSTRNARQSRLKPVSVSMRSPSGELFKIYSKNNRDHNHDKNVRNNTESLVSSN